MSLYSLIASDVVAGNSALTTAAKDFTGADIIGVILGTYAIASPDATHITDSEGNTYIKADSQLANGDGNLVISGYYTLGPSVSNAQTVSFDIAAFGALIVMALGQGGTAPTPVQTSKNGGTGGFDTSIQAGSLGLNPYDLYLAGSVWYVNNPASIDSGFQDLTQNPYTGGAGVGTAMAWLQAPTDPQNPTYSWPLGNVVAALNMAFTGVGPSAAGAKLLATLGVGN